VLDGLSLLRAEGFFCNLDVLYGGLGTGKSQFLIKKKFNFFFICIFFQFWDLKPWIRIGSGSELVFSLKCWIRIQMKRMRIRNPDSNTHYAYIVQYGSLVNLYTKLRETVGVF
jgi:hypothetical protein